MTYMWSRAENVPSLLWSWGLFPSRCTLVPWWHTGAHRGQPSLHGLGHSRCGWDHLTQGKHPQGAVSSFAGGNWWWVALSTTTAQECSDFFLCKHRQRPLLASMLLGGHGSTDGQSISFPIWSVLQVIGASSIAECMRRGLEQCAREPHSWQRLCDLTFKYKPIP